MMKRVVLATMVMTLASVGAASAQIGVYIPPQCEVDTKHFLAKQAQQYVKAASEARNPEDGERALQDAFRTLNDAIERGEEGNAAVWYFFGRAYVIDEDYAGADSAFSKVEAMLPECAEDTDTYRYQLFVAAWNPAVGLLQAGDFSGAKPDLIKANTIYHKEPNVPFYLATAHARDGETEEGLTRFKETVDLIEKMARDSAGDASTAMDRAAIRAQLAGSADSAYAELYDVSVFNTARLFHQQAEWDSAATWYLAYREIHPDDVTSLQAAAGVLEMAGRTDESTALYAELMERTDDLPAQELFQTGVSLFQVDQYELAARAFVAGLEKNPYFRDGHYNLGQSYFALASPFDEDSTAEPSPEELAKRTEWALEMLEAAQALEEVDPLNVSSLQMLVQAYHLLGEADSTAAVIDRLNAMDFEFVVTGFTPLDGGVELVGEVVNLRENEIEFPGITIRWVDADGNTLMTDAIPPQTIPGMERVEFQFSPMGEGIAAWLYEVTEGS